MKVPAVRESATSLISDPTHNNDKLDELGPIFIGLAMSIKILGSTASHPIFWQLIARTINLGLIHPILYKT